MSFAIWKEKPPFEFAPDDPEQIYQVGEVWVVTSDPSKATQEEVDAVNDAVARPAISLAELAALLVEKSVLTQEEISGPADG